MSEASYTVEADQQKTLKTYLKSYLEHDDAVRRLQTRLTELRQRRSEEETRLAEYARGLQLGGKAIQYHNSKIEFTETSPTVGLSQKLIQESIENYFTASPEWRHKSETALVSEVMQTIRTERDRLNAEKPKQASVRRSFAKK